MKFILQTSIIIVFTCLSMASDAKTSDNDKDIIIVVHRNNPISSMTKSQVIDLFMGKYIAFPDGKKALPLDLNTNTQIRKEFYKKLVGMSLARVNSYWSRIKFTGRVRPLLKISSEKEVISYLSDTEQAIGYISRANLNKQLKIVYQFNE